MTQQIGILFWGCKGGHRNFCDNGVVDVYSTEIRQTYKDVRSFATFSVVNTDFYALEFTKDYKVYTHYRSSNDSGSGAFIALTLYVPNSLLVTDIRQIMDKMVDEYFYQYFNPITNSPIPGMMDDITPFQQMFDAFAADHVIPDKTRYSKRPSSQDNTPKIFAYSSLDEVDAYFASPYRPEFFDCQEVMFISKEILQNQSQYGLRFQVSPTLIEKVSEPEPEPYINFFPESQDFRLTKFIVNGTDHTARQGDVPLYAQDRISIRIDGNKYQRPIVMENVGVDEVVQAGIIKKKGKSYEFLPVYNLDYAEFNLQAHIVGDDTNTYYRCYALRSLDDPRLTITGTQFDPRSGMFVFPVSGKYLNQHFQLIYSVDPNFSIPTLIIPLMEVDVEGMVAQRQTLQLSLQRHIFSFVYGDKMSQLILFKINSSDKSKSISGKIKPSERTEIYLPTEFSFTQNDVQLHADDYTIKLDTRGRYQVNPQMIDVEVEMPRLLMTYDVSALIPIYIIGEEKYKGYWTQNRQCFIRLPFEWIDKEGKLILAGHSFQFEEISRTKISFSCAVVNNRTNMTLSYDVIFEDLKTETRTLQPKNIDILPSTVDVRIAPECKEKAEVEEQGFTTDRKTKLFILVERQLQEPSDVMGFDIDELDDESNSNSDEDETTSKHQAAATQGTRTECRLVKETNYEENEDENTSEADSEADSESEETIDEPSEDSRGQRRPGEFTHPRAKKRLGGNTHNQGNGRNSNNNNRGNNRGGNSNSGSNANSTSGGTGNNANSNNTNNQRTQGTATQSDGQHPVYQIKLINCDSLKVRVHDEVTNTNKVEPLSNRDTSDYLNVNPARGQVKILDSREKEICVVNFPLSVYRRDPVLAQRNIENGFDVNWVDDNRCMVYYRKANIFTKLRSNFNNNKKALLGVISILIIALITGFWVFLGRNTEDFNLDLRFSVKDTNAVDSRISCIGYKGYQYKGDSLVVSNNGDILNIEVSENPTVVPSNGGELSDLFIVYKTGLLVPITKNNAFTDTTLEAVIYPEDIRIIPTVNPPVNTDVQTPTAANTWDMDSIFFLLSNPEHLDRNIKLNLELPPLSYLEAYQELVQLPEIDNEKIDSLAKVYPQYQSRIIKLKEPAIPSQADQQENAAGTGANDGNSIQNQAPTPNTQPEGNKGIKETPSQTSPAQKSPSQTPAAQTPTSQTPTTPAPDPNEALKQQYRDKIAQLDGTFTKEMVDDIIKFRDKNNKALADEVKKHKKKLDAYYNFVTKKDFDTTKLTLKQQEVIRKVKSLKPEVVNNRDYPTILKEYQATGAK